MTSLGNQVCDVLFPAQWPLTCQGPQIHPASLLHTPACDALGPAGDDADTQTSGPGKAPSGGEAGAEAGGDPHGASEGKGPELVVHTTRLFTFFKPSPKPPFFSCFATFSRPFRNHPPPAPQALSRHIPQTHLLAAGSTLHSCLHAGASRSQTLRSPECSTFYGSERPHPGEGLGSWLGSAPPDPRHPPFIGGSHLPGSSSGIWPYFPPVVNERTQQKKPAPSPTKYTLGKEHNSAVVQRPEDSHSLLCLHILFSQAHAHVHTFPPSHGQTSIYVHMHAHTDTPHPLPAGTLARRGRLP